MMFRTWLESVSAEDVLRIVQNSPNMQTPRSEEEWRKYAERWGVVGNFIQTIQPAMNLGKMVENQRLYISKYDESEVLNRMKSGQFNSVVITYPQNNPKRQFVVVDGTHSLVAAVRLACSQPSYKKKMSINLTVIHPENFLTSLKNFSY